METKTVVLWEGAVAPYTEYSPAQAQPSMTGYVAEGSVGAVLVCPGGGYGMKAEYEGVPVAKRLAEYGITAFSLDYRVAPCHRLAPLTDAQRAIRLLREMGYRKVGILGFSAGGHLACTTVTHADAGNPDSADPIDRHSSRPDALVACYPVVSMGDFTHIGSRNNLLGEYAEDIEMQRKFSAELHIDKDSCPAFVWGTVNDNLLGDRHLVELVSAYARAGVHVTYHPYCHEPPGHGFGLADGDPTVGNWSHLACKWLIGQGFAK